MLPVGVTWRLIVVVVITAFGTGFNMYTTSVVNNAQLVVKPWTNASFASSGKVLTEPQIDALWSVLSAMVYFGGFIGPFVTQLLAKHLGRRYSLMVIAVGNICGGLLVGLAKSANSVVMLFVGRAVLGVFLSLGMGIGSIFITEIAASKYRGACATVLQVSLGASDLIAVLFTMPQLFGTDALWPVAFGVPIVPGIIMLITLVLSPESPSYSYNKTMDPDETSRAIQFYQGEESVSKVLAEIREAKSNFMSHQNVSFGAFITDPAHRAPLTICIVLAIANPCSGVGAVLSYSTAIFIDCGLTDSEAIYGTLGVGITNFVTGLIMIFLIEKLGRRKVALYGIGGCIVSLSLLCICTSLHNSDGYNGRISYVSIGALVCFQASYAVFAPLTFLVPCELFNQVTRSMACMISSCLLWAIASIIVVIYLPLQKAVGVAYSFIPFLVILLFCFIFLMARLPETKGIATATMERSTADGIMGKRRSRGASMFHIPE